MPEIKRLGHKVGEHRVLMEIRETCDWLLFFEGSLENGMCKHSALGKRSESGHFHPQISAESLQAA